ncbi:hypothetical protein AKJ16_DCAP23366 [Drosera capensis]
MPMSTADDRWLMAINEDDWWSVVDERRGQLLVGGSRVKMVGKKMSSSAEDEVSVELPAPPGWKKTV